MPFTIVAEPNRRAILRLLLESDRSVGEIERELRLSQPAVSKHLRVLREGGLVESRIEAQRRLYRLKPEALMELDAWLHPFRQFWSRHLDALEQQLDKMPATSPARERVARVSRGSGAGRRGPRGRTHKGGAAGTKSPRK